MKYKVDSQGQIVHGGGVIFQHPENASANMIAESLNQARDYGYKEAIEHVCRRIQTLYAGLPEEVIPFVRSNVRPKSEEVWNKR